MVDMHDVVKILQGLTSSHAARFGLKHLVNPVDRLMSIYAERRLWSNPTPVCHFTTLISALASSNGQLQFKDLSGCFSPRHCLLWWEKGGLVALGPIWMIGRQIYDKMSFPVFFKSDPCLPE